jgi:hypothetical protein
MGDQPLFKYINREHAEELVSRGTLRLGTLWEFRDTERHGSGIVDPDQGLKYLTEHIGFRTRETMSAFSRPILGTGVMIVRNSDVSQAITAPNVGIYSTSARLSGRLMRKLGYDACVEIIDYPGFFTEVAEELDQQHPLEVDGRHIVWCTYTDRRRPYDKDDGLNPVMLKGVESADEEEVRGVFVPRSSHPISPLLLDVPAVTTYCRLRSDVPE